MQTTNEQIEIIISMGKKGATTKVISNYLGLSNATIKKYRNLNRILKPFRQFDEIISLPSLTPKQNNVIIGSLLGDATLTRKINSLFIKEQSTKKEEYIRWHYDYLQPYSVSVRDGVHKEYFVKNTGYTIPARKSFVFSTHAHPMFTELRKKWYPNGEKIVPKDIILNPQICAIWFADDGTNNSGRMEICTQGFRREDIIFLVEQLQSFGFKCKYVKDDGCTKQNCGYIIQFSAESKKNFIDWIKPFYPWKCLIYKLNFISDSSKAINNTSGYRGVWLNRSVKKWQAEIVVNKKKIYLGRFDKIEDAIEARKIADNKYQVQIGKKWLNINE